MKKRIPVIVAALAVIAILVFVFLNFETVEEHYSETAPTNAGKSVTISIRCDTVLQNSDKLDKSLKDSGLIPPDGVILPETQYSIEDGDTVFDVLQRAVKDKHIQLEYKGESATAYGSVYIEGINYLYEFSCGPLSGWMYKVDGEFPSFGASEYKLRDGQSVEWVYTCDLGEDVGQKTLGGGA